MSPIGAGRTVFISDLIELSMVLCGIYRRALLLARDDFCFGAVEECAAEECAAEECGAS